jgi:hypothetical protein
MGALASAAADQALFVSGRVTLAPDDGLAPGLRSLALLSPEEPRFWPLFRTSPEATDGRPDPLDRWSERTITAIAQQVGGTALFPFGGPPYRPFIAWAKRSGRAHGSPVGLLVHDRAGLFISYRGAIALPTAAPQEDLPASPCGGCSRPCLTACPVSAFATGSYDVPACKAHVRSDAGTDCRTGGCLVRRACPVGQDRRLADQSAFHMDAFL